MEAMISHSHRLGKAFCLVVNAPWTDGIYMSPVALRLRVHLWIAVDLGGRCQQEAGALCLREPQRLVGTERTHLQRLNGKLEVVYRAGRAGEVQDSIQIPLHIDVVGN